MKKLIIFLIGIMITGISFSQLSNTYKYQIKANGGIYIGTNGTKVDSVKVDGGYIYFYTAAGTFTNDTLLGVYNLNKKIDTLYIDANVTTGAGLRKTTIQSAIDAASAGDIIYVKKGTYTEALTVDKNLTIILQGATLTYNGANTTATITNSADLYIYGGIIGRSGATTNAKLISNSGNIKLKDVELRPSNSNSTFWYVYSTAGTVYFDNINTYHYCASPIKRFGGGSYFNHTKAIINSTKYDGTFQIIGTSNVDFTANECLTNGEMVIMSSYYNQLANYGQWSVSVKDRWGKVPNSGNLDSLGSAQSTVIQNQAKLYVHNGIFNSSTSSLDSAHITLYNTRCEYGYPYMGSTAPFGTTKIKWEVYNSVLKNEPFPWEAVAGGAGVHTFEANYAAGDTANIDLIVENSYLTFGDSRDDEGRLGNMFQLGWKGSVRLVNNTIIHYSDDGNVGYKIIGNLLSPIDFEIYNNTFISYGNEDVWSVTKLGTDELNINASGNIFRMLNAGTGKEAFEINSTELAELETADIVNIADNIVQGNGDQTLFDSRTAPYISSMTLNAGSYNNTVYNKLITKGFGQTVNNLVLASDGVKMFTADTLSRTGIDGDSATIRIYLAAPLVDAVGNKLNANKIDLSMTIMASRYTALSYPTANGLYDIRFAYLGTRASTSASTYYFNSNALKAMNQTITVRGFKATNPVDYVEFNLANGSAFPVEYGIWIKQSLNVSYITTTRH